MATANLQLTLLEVGQKEKEVTINTNFSSIDAKIIRYLGEFASDPNTSGIVAGCTYFNTTSGKLKTLNSSSAWVASDGTSADPVWPTEVNTFKINNELIIDASAKIANETSGNYGWNDLVASFIVKATSGLNNPTWGNLFGGMQGYLFSPGSMNQVWVDFHIVHDIALGTVLYPHIHWTPTTTGTGTVRWGIEYSVAKGHQQTTGSIFPATTTVYIEQNIAAPSQWKHFIAEVDLVDAIPTTNIEPDSMVKVRVFRDATHVNDTYTGDVHAWQADIHYQVATLSTKNKSPNFYA